MSDVLEPTLGHNIGKSENKPIKGLPDGPCEKCGKATHSTAGHGIKGGARPGGGRKPGGMNYDTKQRLAIRRAFEDRIHNNADRLLSAALNKALGETFLFCKRTIGTGSKQRTETEIVTDPETIKAYLDEELNDTDDEYYYISTKPVDMVAVKELYDRAFGRASQNIDMTSKGERIGQPIESSQADQLLRLRAQRAA